MKESTLLNRDWPMVLLEEVFTRRKADKLLLAVADVAGTTSVQQPFYESPDLIKI